MKKKAYEAVEWLHVMVRESLEKAKQGTMKPGWILNLEMTSLALKKIRSFEDENQPKKVGVFGAPKRGKSTLLNAILSADLLPMHTVMSTKTAIEVSSQANMQDWEVVIKHENKFVEKTSVKKISEAREIIRKHGSHQSMAPPAVLIQVRGNFPDNKIFQGGGVLVDTPGAEPAFDLKKATETPTSCETVIKEDTAIALDMLKKVHVVTFCISAEYKGDESEILFYNEHLKVFKPFNIINFKDQEKDEKTGRMLEDEEIVKKTLKICDFPWDRTLCVSALWAYDGRVKNKNEKKVEESGIKQIEERIIQEMNELTPEFGLLSCLTDYKRTLENALKENIDLRPKKFAVANFEKSLRAIPIAWSNKIIGFLLCEKDFWHL